MFLQATLLDVLSTPKLHQCLGIFQNHFHPLLGTESNIFQAGSRLEQCPQALSDRQRLDFRIRHPVDTFRIEGRNHPGSGGMPRRGGLYFAAATMDHYPFVDHSTGPH